MYIISEHCSTIYWSPVDQSRVSWLSWIRDQGSVIHFKVPSVQWRWWPDSWGWAADRGSQLQLWDPSWSSRPHKWRRVYLWSLSHPAIKVTHTRVFFQIQFVEKVRICCSKMSHVLSLYHNHRLSICIHIHIFLFFFLLILLMRLMNGCTGLNYRMNNHSHRGDFISEREGILLGRSLCGCTRVRHGAPSHSSGARAAGNPRTEPSSLHLSACAYDYPAAPPPGNLEHITHTHTNEHS